MAIRDPNPLWAYIYVPVDVIVTSDKIPPNILLHTASPPVKGITNMCIGRLVHAPNGKVVKQEDNKDLWDKIKEILCLSRKRT